MEANQHTPSVIARLMGLDEFAPQQRIHKPQRVLSENYLWKTAHLGGLLKKRSFYKGISSRLNIEKQQKESKVLFGVQIAMMDEHHSGSREKSNSNTKDVTKIHELEQLEDGFKTDCFGGLDVGNLHKLKSWLEFTNGMCLSHTKILVPKPNFRKASAARSSFSPSSGGGSQSDDERHKEFHSPVNQDSYDEIAERKKSTSAMKPSRRARVSRGIANKTAQQVRNVITSSSTEISRPEYRLDKTSTNESQLIMPSCPTIFDMENRDIITCSPSNGSSLAREDKKKLFEGRKMTTRFQDLGATRRSCTLGEMLAMRDQEVRPRELNHKLDEHCPCSQFNLSSGNTDCGSPLGISSKDGWKHECVTDLPRSRNIRNHNFVHRDGCSTSQSAPCVDLKNNQKISLVASSEEGFVLSNSTETGFPMSSGEDCQPSPNSVIEASFQKDILACSECSEISNADVHGVWRQLELFKSESEDTSSVGSGMVLSSDEDTGEGLLDHSCRNVMGLFRVEETRNFSYLVDVLDEAGFQGGNMEWGFETWYSRECPVSPLVCEALEKKYGEQMSWEKSERRLLFDHLNAGLMQILSCRNSYMWSEPLSRRFRSRLKRDVVEEDLWMLLVSQGKEVCKDLSEKALGMEMRWLDLGEDISSICTKIQEFMFDELAAELASMFSI